MNGDKLLCKILIISDESFHFSKISVHQEILKSKPVKTVQNKRQQETKLHRLDVYGQVVKLLSSFPRIFYKDVNIAKVRSEH